MTPAVVIVVYAALACSTVKAPPAPTPSVVAGSPAPKPLPAVPDWSVVCKWLNEQGVQKHPSLNPG